MTSTNTFGNDVSTNYPDAYICDGPQTFNSSGAPANYLFKAGTSSAGRIAYVLTANTEYYIYIVNTTNSSMTLNPVFYLAVLFQSSATTRNLYINRNDSNNNVSCSFWRISSASAAPSYMTVNDSSSIGVNVGELVCFKTTPKTHAPGGRYKLDYIYDKNSNTIYGYDYFLMVDVKAVGDSLNNQNICAHFTEDNTPFS